MRILLALLTIVVLSPAAFAGDDFYAQYEPKLKEAIEKGQAHFKDKDLKSAAEQFQKAANVVRMIRVKQYEHLLPEAPNGWVKKKKDEDDYLRSGVVGAMFGEMFEISSDYTNGDKEVEVSIIVDNPMVTAFKDLIKLGNDSVLSGQEKYKSGSLEFEESSYKNELTITLMDSLSIVSIDGKDMTREEGILFADLVDLEAIDNAFKDKDE